MAKTDTVKEQILNKADLADIVSSYVRLKQAGGRLFGLCPFHKEKTPSFSVHPDRQFFHCFGCGKSGNAIDFVMEVENLTFPEAKRFLAGKLGIRIEEQRGRDRPHGEIDRYQVMDIAAQLYVKWLRENQTAIDYIKSRQLTGEHARTFGMGYAPDRWDSLLHALKQRGFPEAVQSELGLIIPRKEGNGFYDRFRHRIMFPIRNTLGRVIAFGGRALRSDEQAKYLNSNDTSLFNKSRVLYLLDRAKKVIKDNGVVIVEGYMDAIALHVHGFEQTVATLGTALTKEHLAILKRYTKDCTLLYDGDAAGINAAKRGVELFFEAGQAVRVVLMPQGLDPDDFLKSRGREELQQLLETAPDGFEFYLSQILIGRNTSTPAGKSEIVNGMLPLLARISEAYIRQDYIRILADRIGSEAAVLQQSVAKALEKSVYRRMRETNDVESVPIKQVKRHSDITKEMLLRLLSFHYGLVTVENIEGKSSLKVIFGRGTNKDIEVV